MHFTSSDSAATLPADYTFTTADKGEFKFSVTYATPGSQTLTATDTVTSTITGSVVTSVVAAPVATHFAVTGPSAVVQTGQAFSVYVEALNAAGHIVPNYTGTVHFTSSDSAATLPADYTFTAADKGEHKFSVTYATPGSQTLTATDTVTSTITGSVATSVVAAPVATHFALSGPSAAVLTGQAFSVIVEALDASGHVVPNYTGTVHFTSSDPAAILPADFTFTSADKGEFKFSVTYETASTQTLTATDTVTTTITGSVVTTVNQAQVATHFRVTAPTAAFTGQPITVEVVALSASGQVVQNYTGTVHFSSSDSAATLPSDFQFTAADHGEEQFTVTYATAGSQTVTATDTATSTITGSAKTSVTVDTPTHFELLAFPAVKAGAAFNVIVVALDAADHIVTNYTGTVHFSSSDSSATLPADYTFVSGDNGQHVFSVTLATLGTDTVSVTDNSTPPIKGSVSIIVF